MTPLVPQGELRARARAHLEASGAASSRAIARSVFSLLDVEPTLADRLVAELLEDDPDFMRIRGEWRLAIKEGDSEPRTLEEVPFVVVDVETTGGRPPADRILEIGAVRVQDGVLMEEWSTLVNPDRPIPWFIQRLTGIDDIEVVDAPSFESVADRFLKFLGSAPFVAHNARFDWRFVNAELLNSRGATLNNARLCTVRLARRLLPDVRYRNLDALAHLFGIPVQSRHRALGDARATARVLVELLTLAGERGVTTESDLASLCGISGTLHPSPSY